MKQSRRVWAALLALLLLAGCGYQRTEPLPYPEPAAAEPGKTVAYVPLDDRPDNVERVIYLAESLGYALEMPEAELYRTRLDHQPKNFGSLQRGEPWSLYTWVLEREAAGCDRYILSLDQLCSGGLVSSRSMTRDDLELPRGGGTVSASGLLEDLLTALAEDGDNVVWLLDSVMRLAPTVGYEGGTLEEYNAVRAYGMEPRKTLTGAELTLENVFDSYERGADGTCLPKEPEAASALERSLEARKRKMVSSTQVQELLAREGYENFRLLIGIDDSSLEDCIQKNEIAYLRKGLRTGMDLRRWDWLLSGVDDLAFKAVTKLYLEESGWRGADVCVRYYGGTEDQPACEYDFQPLTEIMAEHFELFDLTAVPDPAADLQVLVLTQPEDEAVKETCRKDLIKALKENRKEHRPTILIDASNETYGTAFHEALTKGAELGHLIAYSGLLDMAIVTGTALSHGVARYAVLKNGENSNYMDRAWARTLADSVIKDFCYKCVVWYALMAYIRNDLGGDPNNFWEPELDREDLLERMESGMEDVSAKVVRNLERSSFIASLEPYGEARWGGIALENYHFPWDRAFEIGMDIRLGEFRYE